MCEVFNCIPCCRNCLVIYSPVIYVCMYIRIYVHTDAFGKLHRSKFKLLWYLNKQTASFVCSQRVKFWLRLNWKYTVSNKLCIVESIKLQVQKWRLIMSGQVIYNFFFYMCSIIRQKIIERWIFEYILFCEKIKCFIVDE